MGSMRFRVFPIERNTEQLARQAYLTGLDRMSWPVHAAIEEDTLVLHREVSESAKLHAPWPIEGHGELALSTGSLIEREEPYLLPLELARGTVVQVRNQLADWRLIGLTAPPPVEAKMATAIEQLSRAVVEQRNPDAAARLANEAIREALDAANLLAAEYAKRVLTARRRGGLRPTRFLGAELGTELLDGRTAGRFRASFNAARVPIGWQTTESTEGQFYWSINDRQIEWSQKQGLKVLAGPLLLLDHRDLPDWLYLFEDDFDSILQFTSTLVRATVERYRGQVDYWICAGRVTSDVLSMTEQERLRLVARTVELTRDLDPYAPALVSFDRPWAEYTRDKPIDFPSLSFADALVRADLGLTGIMLELNVGFFPDGTMPRHIVEYSRQLDDWSQFGLPLWVSFSVPSSRDDDPLAIRAAAAPLGDWTPERQRSLATRLAAVALSKPAVQGVIWNQLLDSRPHDFPHGGLFDGNGRPKPALAALAALRRKYLDA